MFQHTHPPLLSSENKEVAEKCSTVSYALFNHKSCIFIPWLILQVNTCKVIQSGPTLRKILRSTFPFQMIAERWPTLGAQGKLQESTTKSNE